MSNRDSKNGEAKNGQKKVNDANRGLNVAKRC